LGGEIGCQIREKKLPPRHKWKSAFDQGGEKGGKDCSLRRTHTSFPCGGKKKEQTFCTCKGEKGGKIWIRRVQIEESH